MSDFEDKTQAELYAMVADAEPQHFHQHADTLHDAGTAMESLSKSLKENIDRVEWDGDGGDAFREWGHQLANTTADFSDYTLKISKGLTSVGSSLTTAVNGVSKPPPSTIVPPSPLLQPAIGGATPVAGMVEHSESINMMNKLASTYSTAAKDFAAPPPVFQPMPAAMLPGGGRDEGETEVEIGGGGAQGSAPSGWPSKNESVEHVTTSHTETDGASHAIVVPDAPHPPSGRTRLDSLPPASTLPHAPSAPGGAGGRTDPVDRGGLPPVSGFPPYGGGQRATGGGEYGLPGPGRRPVGGLPAEGEARPGGGTGYPGEDGIVGGTRGGRIGGTGRGGLVVGGEEEPPLPRPGTTGLGEGLSGGSGRYTGGAYGSSRGIGTAPEEETPGYGTGAGGVTGAGRPGGAEGESGMMRPGVGGVGSGTEARRRGRSGHRPDYLVEDEETWTTGDGTNPSVID